MTIPTNFVNRFTMPELFDYGDIEDNWFEKIVDDIGYSDMPLYIAGILLFAGAIYARINISETSLVPFIITELFTAALLVFREDVSSYIYHKSKIRRIAKQKKSDEDIAAGG